MKTKDFYHKIRYELKDINPYKEFRYIIQRIDKGYCDKDLWCFYFYLSKIIANGLKELKVMKHGVPTSFCEEGKTLEESEKDWNLVLDQIIEGFELIIKAEEDEEGDFEIGYFLKDREEKKKIEKKIKEKFPNSDFRFSTEEEDQKILKAFDLFKEHFFSFWD